MTNLRELQENLLNAVVTYDQHSLDCIKFNGNISPQERFLVHRQTILENLVNALRINYPGIWKLIGEDCARGTALAYSHDLNNIPGRDEIEDFGGNFPEFLATFESTKDIVYLKDFARLEWLRSKSYEAINQEAIVVDQLQAIAPETIEFSKLEFNKSVFLMESDFPLSKIQEIINNPNAEPFNLEVEHVYVLIYRVDNMVNTIWLDKHNWQFLKALKEGLNLGDALEVLLKNDSESELPDIFNFMLQRKLVVDIWHD